MASSNRRPPTVTRTATHEGGQGYDVGPRAELALTALTTFSGEDTFYESADQRQKRYVDLVAEVTRRQPRLVFDLMVDLRDCYNIRTAALRGAVEYLRAGGPNARALIDSVCQRADEPAEVVAYWLTSYGRSLPHALRKGVADAAVRLYSERNYLKWGQNRSALVSMADVIELCHPRPVASWQSSLFRYILDQAHHGDGIERYIDRRQDGDGPVLNTIYDSYQLGRLPADARRAKLRTSPATLSAAGYTWERLSGWLPGGMDAEAWEAVIPTMGVMALLRNLRNFDAAGISIDAQRTVEDKLTDVDEVRRSRIFPYRVWSAYMAAPSDRWKYPLGRTLDLATANIPVFDRTLFLVDVSGSMATTVSGRSDIKRYEIATLMGVCAHARATNSSLALFAAHSCEAEPKRGQSPMGVVTDVMAQVQIHIGAWLTDPFGRYSAYGSWENGPLAGLGQGTNLHEAIVAQFDPARHDRVIVFTDEQSMDNHHLSSGIPSIVYFNLGGYKPQTDHGKGRIHIGGFTDSALQVVADIA